MVKSETGVAHQVVFSLSFRGGDTTRHEIDLYDVAHALVGFQRSLALTTHLVLNDEIITQAPALKNASIRAFPPAAGSWEIMAGISIAATALYYLGTAPKDTPLGHLIYSAYDYVVKAALGFRVDYSKSLGEQYEELKSKEFQGPILNQSRLDSLVEKCEPALRDLHRPISAKGTAESAQITARVGRQRKEIGVHLTRQTFEYLDESFQEETPMELVGRVTSYNSNTYKGRIFIPSEGRPIAFELSEFSRDDVSLGVITTSLVANTLQPTDRYAGFFDFVAYRRTSRTGIVKSLFITKVKPPRRGDQFSRSLPRA